MGKPSAKTQITEYRMSVQLGVCLSADAITRIWVNEKQAWAGRSTDQDAILINEPDLFGGQKKEGGLVGYVTHLPGDTDQVMPADLASKLGKTPETCPAFRGLTTLFFTGGGPAVGTRTNESEFLIVREIMNRAADRSQSGGAGFSWSFNNPIIAQTVWIGVERAPKTPLNPAQRMIGVDANPAHIIAECLTNASWGMGAPESTLDIASFNAAGQTLFEENFGLSMKWTRQARIEDFISEILDHIQATLYLNPRTGKWNLKLLRDDYDVGTLRTISPDNAILTNFQRRLWGEAGNQCIVTWTNPLKEEEETVTAEDLGSINAQGGSPVAFSRNYYGIRNRDLALRVAQRDVRSSAAPLATATAEVDRSFWATAPGDVFLLNWPEKGIYNLVVRALSVDRGSPESGRIKLPLLEDIFSLEKPPVHTPQDGGWVDPSDPPEPIDATQIFTLPYYFTASADLQSAAIDLEFPEVLAAVLAYQESPDVRSYTLAGENGANFKSHGSKSIVERTVLPLGLPWETQSRLDEGLVLNKVRGPKVGSFVFLGAGAESAIEIAQITSYDEDAGEWVLTRGLLDTVPRAWPAGTPAWFVNKGLNLVDEVELRSVGETVGYKLLPRTSKGVLPIEDADLISATMTARPHLPLRPANVKVNGIASGSFNGGAADTLLVTWATRNRTLEDAVVAPWTMGPVGPEYEQGTVVTVYDQDGVKVFEQWGLWTETELALQRSWFDRYAAITIEVTSRNRDLNSLQGHRIAVTGLANNPAAPPPPVPPEPGPPPSPDPAPAAGAWAVTGSAFVLNEAGKVVSSVPAILVSGARDRVTAIELIVRYKKVGTNDWFYLAPVALTDLPTQASTTSVVAKTEYAVEVAYRSSANILSAWRSLGTVTTGALVADGVGDLTYESIKNALAFFTSMDDETQAALGQLDDVIAGVKFHEEAILSQFLVNVEDKARFEALMHMPDGKEVATFAAEEREERITDKEAFLFNFSLLGAKKGDNSAWILNAETVLVNETQTLAQFQQAITGNFDDVYGTIQDTLEIALDASGAVASELHVLGVKSPDGSAFIIDENKAKYSSTGQTVAQRFTGISASIDTARATAVSQAQAYVDNSSAFAQVLSTLGVSVGGFSATITELSETSNEFGARLGVKLNVNGHVVGWVANNDGLTGGFTFAGDYFAIATSGGTVKPFLVVGSTVRMQNVLISGGLVVDGTITGGKIVGGAVTNMLQYETAAVVPLGAGENGHLSYSYPSEGGKHVVSVYADIGTLGANPAGAVVRLRCDGVQVGYANLFCPGGPWGGTGLTFQVGHTPGAGYRNYTVSYEPTPGSGSARINRTNVVITELKK